METLLASTFTGIVMFVMGFWLARMIYLPQIHSAELRGLTNRRVLVVKPDHTGTDGGEYLVRRERRTDAENAAGMVS